MIILLIILLIILRNYYSLYRVIEFAPQLSGRLGWGGLRSDAQLNKSKSHTYITKRIRQLAQSSLESTPRYLIAYELNQKFQSTVSEKFLCVWHRNGMAMNVGAALLG